MTTDLLIQQFSTTFKLSWENLIEFQTFTKITFFPLLLRVAMASKLT